MVSLLDFIKEKLDETISDIASLPDGSINRPIVKQDCLKAEGDPTAAFRVFGAENQSKGEVWINAWSSDATEVHSITEITKEMYQEIDPITTKYLKDTLGIELRFNDHNAEEPIRGLEVQIVYTHPELFTHDTYQAKVKELLEHLISWLPSYETEQPIDEPAAPIEIQLADGKKLSAYSPDELIGKKVRVEFQYKSPALNCSMVSNGTATVQDGKLRITLDTLDNPERLQPLLSQHGYQVDGLTISADFKGDAIDLNRVYVVLTAALKELE